MKRILAVLLLCVWCVSALSACGGRNDYVPSGFQRISHDNADYYLYVPTGWVPDLSTGVTAAYVSEKDRSSISFMAFEVDDTLIQAAVGSSSSDETPLDSEAQTTEAVTEGDVTTESDVTTDGETLPEELPAITTVEEYWAYYEGQFKATFSDLAYTVEGENVMLAGMKAKKYVYTATVTGETYQFMQVVALKAGTVYIFTYTSTKAVFDSHLEDVNAILGYISLK